MHDKLTIQSVLNRQALDADIAARYPVDGEGEHILYDRINERGVFFQLNSDYSRENSIVNKKILQKLESSLYITKITDVDVTILYTRLSIKTSCKVRIPFKVVKQLLGNDKMTYKVTISKDVFRPAEFVRIYTVFSEVIEDTKVGDEVLGKLHNVLKGGS